MEKKNRSSQAAETLYNQIVVERRLAPGDKLPCEVDLSRQLGVSRTTLREALRDLTVQGILEVRRGRGTFVSQHAWEVEDFGFDSLRQVRGQLRELFELRSIFEPRAAALACRRASSEELDGILARGAEVERKIRTGEDRTAADWAFHTAIVRAAHNGFLLRLLPMIHQAVETAISTGGHKEELARITLQDHALLLEFFKKRDERGVEYAMAIHMRHAMDEMELE